MRRIGIDFDNTIICYDAVFSAAAIARGLLPGDFLGTKTEVRDAVRALPDGERTWQALQGHVYGAGIGGATPFVGFSAFLERARDAGAEVVVVSHKTLFGHHDSAQVNLREAALGWLDTQGFFAADGGLARERVHFAPTRDDKLRRIAALAPEVFIDDLPEVLDDPKFPAGVRPLLFSGDWGEASEAVFDERA